MIIAVALAIVVAAGHHPPPLAPIPRSPAALAAALQRTDGVLRPELRAWIASGAAAPPESVTLDVLFEQRIDRVLAEQPKLGAAVLARLSPALARHVGDDAAAHHELVRITPPIPLRSIRTEPAAPAAALRTDYLLAQRRFGVSWDVLAAINFVESAFGKLRSASAAGALGPLQFLPATWRRYGLGGNVQDPHDAILGAANYLRASGAPRDYRRALFAYNPSPLYVDAILRYSREIARDPLAFYEYYCRQVYVHTTEGYRRVTGPGR